MNFIKLQASYVNVDAINMIGAVHASSDYEGHYEFCLYFGFDMEGDASYYEKGLEFTYKSEEQAQKAFDRLLYFIEHRSEPLMENRSEPRQEKRMPSPPPDTDAIYSKWGQSKKK